MLKKLWAAITGDSVHAEVDTYGTGTDHPRYRYSAQMIAEINAGQRYQIVSNRAQTQIYIVDSLYKQRVGRFYDISYALIVADGLNRQTQD